MANLEMDHCDDARAFIFCKLGKRLGNCNAERERENEKKVRNDVLIAEQDKYTLYTALAYW